MSADSIREQMIQRLRAGIREDFAEQLATALEAAPTADAIKAAAIKSPDRWGQLVAVLARLTGFRDQVDVHADASLTALVARLATMSDGELVSELRALRAAESVVPLPLAQPSTAAPSAADAAPAADGVGVSPAAPTATGPRAACA